MKELKTADDLFYGFAIRSLEIISCRIIPISSTVRVKSWASSWTFDSEY